MLDVNAGIPLADEPGMLAKAIELVQSVTDVPISIDSSIVAALEAANVTSSEGTLNRQAKSAARSAFESAKQRFFNHLITAMKTPTLIAAIDQGLADGHAAVVQIVSTGEALLSRRLADIDPGEWNDVQVDITPREYV